MAVCSASASELLVRSQIVQYRIEPRSSPWRDAVAGHDMHSLCFDAGRGHFCQFARVEVRSGDACGLPVAAAPADDSRAREFVPRPVARRPGHDTDAPTRGEGEGGTARSSTLRVSVSPTAAGIVAL